MQSPTDIDEPQPAVISRPADLFKNSDENFEKPIFFPPKPLPQNPKISPSSIPNPNPSVITNKHVESAYSGYGGHLYNIPGYSAFQPVSHTNVVQPTSAPIITDSSIKEFPFSPNSAQKPILEENIDEHNQLEISDKSEFEKHLTPKVSASESNVDTITPIAMESKMSITSLVQGSGATITMPSHTLPTTVPTQTIPALSVQTDVDAKNNPGKYSLKTSIPISKIDLKCISNSIDSALPIKPQAIYNPSFQKETTENSSIGLPTKNTLIVNNSSFQKENLIQSHKSLEEMSNKMDVDNPNFQDENKNAKPLNESNDRNVNLAFQNEYTDNIFVEITKNIQVLQRDNMDKVNVETHSNINNISDSTLLQNSKIEKPNETAAIEASIGVNNSKLCQEYKNEPRFEERDTNVNNLYQKQNKETRYNKTVFNNPAFHKDKNRSSLGKPISNIHTKIYKKNNEIQRDENTNAICHNSPPFHKDSTEKSRVEIHSNIVIKSAITEPDKREKFSPILQNSSISTLINAAEAINKNEGQLLDAVTEPKPTSPVSRTNIPRPVFYKTNLESNKSAFSKKLSDGGFMDTKNQILFIQNKSPLNSNITLTLQPNPHVLLQRTNLDPKNLQAPSRVSNQSKKSKDELLSDSGPSSKVVALKRLHQDNCDENDFENLITENQIYGNKIVVKEKSQGTQQEQDLRNKNKDKQMQQEQPKNLTMQQNFIYVSSMPLPNMTAFKNNSKISTSDTTKIKLSADENKKNEDVIINKAPTTLNKDVHVLKANNKVLHTNNNNNKVDLPPTQPISRHQKIMTPQVLFQVECENKNLNGREVSKKVAVKRESTKASELTQISPSVDTKEKDKEKLYLPCPYQIDSSLQPKIVIKNIKSQLVTSVEEVISTLDVYERNRRIKRLNGLSITIQKKVETRQDTRRAQDKVNCLKNIITPDKMKEEIFKEFATTKGKLNDLTDESDSDNEENELCEYASIIEEYGGEQDKRKKINFFAGLRLTTHQTRKNIELEKQERSLKFDSVATAYAATRLLHGDAKPEHPAPKAGVKLPRIGKEHRSMMLRKQLFLSELKLNKVPESLKHEYEKTWQAVMRDRRRRYGTTDNEQTERSAPGSLDPDSQLELLTQIKRSVNINNNLIKKRLDAQPKDSTSPDIRILAEKNFSELNRLSKMADHSVKLYSGQETRKRDLNPGFDSEKIKKITGIQTDPWQNYPKLNIPSISKIISLKSTEDTSALAVTPAISMDEPASGASEGALGGKEARGSAVERSEVSCQAGEGFPWPGIDAFIQSYREYEIASKKEMSELNRRNTALRVESAHVTRSASRDSDRARALLAERQHLAAEESLLRASLQRLMRAVDLIKNS